MVSRFVDDRAHLQRGQNHAFSPSSVSSWTKRSRHSRRCTGVVLDFKLGMGSDRYMKVLKVTDVFDWVRESAVGLL